MSLPAKFVTDNLEVSDREAVFVGVVIARLDDEEVLHLATVGWGTVSTKIAMNRALEKLAPGYRVAERGGEWLVLRRSTPVAAFDDAGHAMVYVGSTVSKPLFGF